MFLTSKDILNFDESDLKDFLNKKIIEGHHIDYKVDLSGESDKSKIKEFLKDISAFANANGGDLFIGVKEPDENLSVEDQIVGIEDGENTAKKLERVSRDCIEPRIPGLQLIPVKLTNNKYVILAHVPPSLNKPHMVVFGKHQYLFIRHRESTNPMTIHELKGSVFSSASIEAKAKAYLEEKEVVFLRYDVKFLVPVFLLQAIPLIPPDQPWNLLNSQVNEICSGQERTKYMSGYDLRFHNPYPTIDGIRGEASEKLILEIHRNGYIFVAFFNELGFGTQDDYQNGNKRKVIYLQFEDLFKAFCDLCSSFVNFTESDLPFVLRCKYLNANKSQLVTGNQLLPLSQPYKRDEIFWADQIRQVGEEFSPIGEVWFDQLFNAFGLKRPKTQPGRVKFE